MIERKKSRISTRWRYLNIGVSDDARISKWKDLPIHNRSVIRVIGFGVAPIVANFVRHRILIQFDPQPRPRRQIKVPVANFERILDVPVAQAHLLLTQEVRNRSGDLQPGGQGYRAERIVRRDIGVIRLGHSGDQAHFSNAARMAEIGLKDRRRALLQNLTETPLGEDAFARGDGNVRRLRQLGHQVYVLTVDDLFVKEGLELLQLFHQDFCRRGWDRAVEINADVAVLADDFAQAGELGDGVFDPGFVFDRPRIAAVQARGAGLERGEALRLALADQLRRARMRVDADALARGAAQEFVNRDAEQFALDVPERLVNPGERARQNGPAAIEGVAIDRLPVMHNGARVFADQVRFHLLDRRGAGQRAAFGDRLAQAHDSGVGVNFQEKPARFDQEGFEPRNLDAFARGRSRGLLNDFGDRRARLNDLFGVRFGAGDGVQRAEANGRGGGVFEQRTALQVGRVFLFILVFHRVHPQL